MNCSIFLNNTFHMRPAQDRFVDCDFEYVAVRHIEVSSSNASRGRFGSRRDLEQPRATALGETGGQTVDETRHRDRVAPLPSTGPPRPPELPGPAAQDLPGLQPACGFALEQHREVVLSQ